MTLSAHTPTLHRIDGHICLSVPALVAMGLSESLVWKQMSTGVWPSFEDATDHRRKWVLYSGLPAVTREKVDNWYRAQGGITRAFERQQLLERLAVRQEDKSFFQGKVDDNGRAHYTYEQTAKLAETAAWMRLALSVTNKQQAVKEGYGKLSEWQDAVFQCWLEGNPFYPTTDNFNKWLQYLGRFQKEGLDCLVSGKLGNRNSEKVGEAGRQEIVRLYANPLKPTALEVTRKYNEWATANGLPRICAGRVKQILEEPGVKTQWYAARHGVKAYKNNMEPIAIVARPSFPDALWVLDGTRLQLLKQDKGFVYYVRVWDVYSGRMWAEYGQTETEELVAKVLQRAMSESGHRPWQLRYDPGSANTSKFVSGLMSRMVHKVHFPTQPQNSRANAAERMIKKYEQEFLRKEPNFVGGNITTKGLQSKANDDFVKLLVQSKALPQNAEALIKQAKLVDERWNNTILDKRTGKTPLQLYAEAHEKRVATSAEDVAALFRMKRERTMEYNQQGIGITVGETKAYYWVEDADGAGDWDFREKWQGTGFEVWWNPSDMSRVELQVGGKFVAIATLRREFASCVADMEEGVPTHHAFVEKRQEKRKKQVNNSKEIYEQVAATSLNHFFLDKDALNEAEHAQELAEIFGPVNGRASDSEATSYYRDYGDGYSLEVVGEM